jgi:hypothetical protein
VCQRMISGPAMVSLECFLPEFEEPGLLLVGQNRQLFLLQAR